MKSIIFAFCLALFPFYGFAQSVTFSHYSLDANVSDGTGHEILKYNYSATVSGCMNHNIKFYMVVNTPVQHARHKYQDGSDMCSVSENLFCQTNSTSTNDGSWLGIYQDQLNPLPGENTYYVRIEAKDETMGRWLGGTPPKPVSITATQNRVPVLVNTYYTPICLIKVDEGSDLGRKFNSLKGIEAAKMIRPLAEQGNPEAQFFAAKCFYEGIGVNKDYAKALHYARLAADTPDEQRRNLSTGAQHNLAQANVIVSKICYEGIDGKKDVEMAYKYARQLIDYSYYRESLYGELLEYYRPKDYGLYFRLACRYMGYGKMSDAEYDNCANSYADPNYLRDIRRQCVNDIVYGYLTGTGCEKDAMKALSYCDGNNEIKAEVVDCLLSDTDNIEHLRTAVYQIDTYRLSNTNYAKDANIAGSYWKDKYQNALLVVWANKPSNEIDKFFDQHYKDDLLSLIIPKMESADQTVLQKELEQWQKHAESGSVSAMYIISMMYEKGLGTTENKDKAKEWASKAWDVCVNNSRAPNKLYHLCRDRLNALNKVKYELGGFVNSRGIIVDAEEVQSSNSYLKKGPLGKHCTIYSTEISQMTYQEVKAHLKECECVNAIDGDRVLWFYKGLAKQNIQFKAGKYWNVTSKGQFSLVEIDTSGHILATITIDNLSKQDKKEAYYFINVDSFFDRY